MWARIVDGFRCDVASFVPVEFGNRRGVVSKVNSDCIWLAESVHSSFNVFFLARAGFIPEATMGSFDALIWNSDLRYP